MRQGGDWAGGWPTMTSGGLLFSDRSEIFCFILRLRQGDMERWGFRMGHRDGRKWSVSGWPMWTSASQPGLWRAGSLCPRVIRRYRNGEKLCKHRRSERVGEFGR